MLADKNRIALRPDPHAWLESALAHTPMHEAPITVELAAESRRIGFAHEDPADRFLAATAAVLDLTLVSYDRRLLAGSGYRTMSNR